ncbi:hypothetical protein [Streptomyces sp. enrichment culture]|uniref:hypothetical protein n=1 Tax=Streptomyces sp. enrichment culture TaxID=1795815 RepID=UPI003F5604DE
MTATAFEYGPEHVFVDPYACGDDFLLSPPNPADRLDITLDPRDRRRLDLHAALTAAGIPPRPEDREAIESLSALPGSINTTIQRWLHHTL